MIGRNDPCFCGSGKKWKSCHYPTQPVEESQVWLRKDAAAFYRKRWGILLKTDEQIKGIKNACVITAKILDALCEKAKAGITTDDLNSYAIELHEQYGVIAAPFGYGNPPFPKYICTSLNEVICHGIPDKTILKEGDFLNIDVSCIADGYYGDCSRMVAIGDLSPEKQNVYDVSRISLYKSVAALKPGVLISQIGQVITKEAHAHGCSVVDRFVGHGVGIDFHEAPEVPHHRNNIDIPVATGMTFTIEPMINVGVKDGVVSREDGWTAWTKDRKPSAQWEHTILITETGAEILTPWAGSLAEYEKIRKQEVK